MGVSGGGDLLYSLKNLDLAQLVSIATSRAAVNGRTVPRIDIDANWLIRKYSKDGSILIGSIIEVISAFVLRVMASDTSDFSSSRRQWRQLQRPLPRRRYHHPPTQPPRAVLSYVFQPTKRNPWTNWPDNGQDRRASPPSYPRI